MGDTEVAVVGDTVVAVGGQADVLIPEPDDGPTDLGEVLSALIAEQSAGRQARICCFDCFVFFFSTNWILKINPTPVNLSKPYLQARSRCQASERASEGCQQERRKHSGSKTCGLVTWSSAVRATSASLNRASKSKRSIQRRRHGTY